MAARGVVAVLKAVPGAVMLGMGTVFQPKVDPRDHWSSSPKVVLVDEVHEVDAGAPPAGPPTS